MQITENSPKTLQIDVAMTSTLPPDARLLHPRFATPEAIDRTWALCAMLADSELFGPGNVGVSLAAAYSLDLAQVAAAFTDVNLPINSFDLADVVTPAELVLKMLNAFAGREHLKNERTPGLKERILQGKLHVGWSAVSTLSKRSFLEKTTQASQITQQPVTARMNAEFILKRPLFARQVLQALPHGTRIAIEQDSETQTGPQFLTFITFLLREYPNIVLEFDAGKAAVYNSEKKKPTVYEAGQEMMSTFELLMKNPELRKRFAILSPNAPFISETGQTHGNLLQYQSQFESMAREIGKSVARGDLSTPPTIIPEPSPVEYDIYRSPAGKKYFQALREEYDEGRGISASPVVAH